MKKYIAVTTACLISLNTFGYDDKLKSADLMAQQFVHSLQQSSATAFVELLPSLQDFHQIMDANSRAYGRNLREAKEEFASNYSEQILPQAKESFEALLQTGKEQGIDWNNVSFVRLETLQGNTETSIASFFIVLSSQGKEFKIRVKSALQINGQWKVSQFVKLV